MTNEIRFKFSADKVQIQMVERILKDGLKGWEVMYGPNIKPRGSYGSLVDVSMGFKTIPSFYREDLGVSLTNKEYKAAMDLINDAEGKTFIQKDFRGDLTSTNSIKCFLIVGIPASGKSSYAKKLGRDKNAVIVSTDAIRAKLYGSEEIQGNWSEIETLLHQSINEYVAKGISVIVDATNIKPEHRKPLLKLSNLIKWECYWLDAELENCYVRNEKRARKVPKQVIRSMYKQLELTPPRREEGFVDVHQMMDNIPMSNLNPETHGGYTTSHEEFWSLMNSSW
tara:strand:+ start:9409 stop:10254 length:846 start_codon:yes stop_codon:yes gene_type:complete